MALSCDCGMGDYEWFYQITDTEYSANSNSRCYGCCREVIHVGDEVLHILSYEMDEDGNEFNNEVLGRICEECSGLFYSLEELGYCLDADGAGFIADGMREYREMLPASHIMKPAMDAIAKLGETS